MKKLRIPLRMLITRLLVQQRTPTTKQLEQSRTYSERKKNQLANQKLLASQKFLETKPSHNLRTARELTDLAKVVARIPATVKIPAKVVVKIPAFARIPVKVAARTPAKAVFARIPAKVVVKIPEFARTPAKVAFARTPTEAV